MTAFIPEAWDPVNLRAAIVAADHALQALVKAHNHLLTCDACRTDLCGVYDELVGLYVAAAPFTANPGDDL